MKIINSFMPYIYGVLIIALLGVLIAFFVRLAKTLKQVKGLADNASGISQGLQQLSKKTERISASKDSWTFFAGILAIQAILKEIRKDRKNSKPLPRSLAKAMIRHSSQISRIRF